MQPPCWIVLAWNVVKIGKPNNDTLESFSKREDFHASQSLDLQQVDGKKQVRFVFQFHACAVLMSAMRIRIRFVVPFCTPYMDS